MLVTTRDAKIIKLISRFGMLRSGIIRELIFSDSLSATSSDRALKRLVERKYLARVERRLIGGNGAGSGQYIYRLGTQGRRIAQTQGNYSRLSDIHHTIAIAETFVAVKRLEQQGLLEVVGYATEPDSWATVAGAELRPDLHIEMAIPSRRVNVTFFIEVDLGTERQKQLKEKMRKYIHAWQHSDESDVPTFPVVLFLVPDEERMKEIQWLIDREDEEVRGLFMVEMQESFPQFLFS
ncbi:replication-relaxation family protein [Arthrobacter cavernae]|uniref:Replication-relaxation family protein n=1 Tax=Arthrobacter cavernae TaxID=2817681 RepID=A0A939KLB4_9MICC|nr:replication-relaxation family protein [Arthrobacter cavernae]MBO1267073.1 replication-relaxation family protein [Arthrobacter cavernae]